MPGDRKLVRLSKMLSRFLRHAPHELGLTLERGGWVRVDDLLAALNGRGTPVTREALREVVVQSDKRRFSLDEAEGRVRANQGHSVAVDLDLAPLEPPGVLYHGTTGRFLKVILKQGLKPMGRHHVHLSADTDTARKVGARRGPPVVLQVQAARMSAGGFTFYRSENGVWLTDGVPPAYLRVYASSRASSPT